MEEEEIAAAEAAAEAEANEAGDDQQQGSIQPVKPALEDKEPMLSRWLRQVKYENFMEVVRKMWDQMANTAQVKQQKRWQAKQEETEK